MNVFIGSTSSHKVDAVKSVLIEVFPHQPTHVVGVKVSSDIHEQPVGNEETITGALHRLSNLKKEIGNDNSYDFLIAFENGITSVIIEGKERWFDVGWVVIENAEGKRAVTHSTGIEFDSDFVQRAREIGFDKVTVGSLLAQTVEGDPTDPHKYCTNNLVSRKDMLEQALKTALGQLILK